MWKNTPKRGNKKQQGKRERSLETRFARDLRFGTKRQLDSALTSERASLSRDIIMAMKISHHSYPSLFLFLSTGCHWIARLTSCPLAFRASRTTVREYRSSRVCEIASIRSNNGIQPSFCPGRLVNQTITHIIRSRSTACSNDHANVLWNALLAPTTSGDARGKWMNLSRVVDSNRELSRQDRQEARAFLQLEDVESCPKGKGAIRIEKRRFWGTLPKKFICIKFPEFFSRAFSFIWILWSIIFVSWMIEIRRVLTNLSL